MLLTQAGNSVPCGVEAVSAGNKIWGCAKDHNAEGDDCIDSGVKRENPRSAGDWDMINFSLASRKGEMLDALTKVMSIESVKDKPQGNMPYGKGVFDALWKMLSLADHLDFDSVNFFSHLGYVEYGDGDEMLAVLTHLDVVPAGDGWTVPPFGATLKDGRIYGRGAIDNKGPAIAALFALSAIKENCISLRKRVRLIFGCDEESDWSDIAFYKNNGGEIPTMAISPDACFPIINTEKALLHLAISHQIYEVNIEGGLHIRSIFGGDRVNVVPSHGECELVGHVESAKQMAVHFNEGLPVQVRVEDMPDGAVKVSVEGVSAHGSRPDQGINALAYLIMFLNTLPLKKNYLSDMVYALAEKIGLQLDGQSLGIQSEDFSGALTLNLGYLHSDGETIEAGLDIRYPLQQTQEAILEQVKQSFEGFDVEVRSAKRAIHVPEDSVLIQGLKQAYEEITDEKAYCMSIGGATYARAFDNSVAFGALFPGEEGTEHQADESIAVDSLIRLADILANAIVVLCNGYEEANCNR